MNFSSLPRANARFWFRFALLGMLAISSSLAMGEPHTAPTAQSSLQSMEADFRRAEEIDMLMHGMPAFLSEQKVPLATIRNLASRYGETLLSFPNPHVMGETTLYRKFEFDGMELYGAMLEPSALSPISVVVTKPGWPIGRGLSVGVSEQAVLDALGEPSSRDANRLVYNGTSDSMAFHVANQQVVEVEFDFYFD